MDVVDQVKQVFVKSSKPQPTPELKKSRRVLPKSKPAVRRATAHKTYPMGALKGTRQTRRAKLEPTNNPSKSPPMKSAARKTIRVLTPIGQQKKEQRAEQEGSVLSVARMRAELAKAGHGPSDKAPDHLVIHIWKAANIGGFLK
jgi:hypothetical protein